MGNRTSQPQTIRSRRINRSLSQIDATSWPAIMRPRRSGSVQAYLQSPSVTLRQYLQLHSEKYPAAGDPDVGRPFGYENSYEQIRELFNNQSDSVYRSAHAAILDKHSEGLGRREGRWFHEMRFRTERTSRDRETSMEGATMAADIEGTVDTEAVVSRVSSENDDTKPEHVTAEPTSSSQNFNQIGERPLSTTSIDRYHHDSSYSCCLDRSRKTHSCYRFVDPRSEDASEAPSRSPSAHRSQKNVARQSSKCSRHRFDRGDWNMDGSSTSNALNKSEITRRCSSACSSRNTKSELLLGLPRQMGFKTQPDGLVTYTAFLRSGPCGTPVEGWLNELRRKASRHLTGLYRQYQCTVRIEPRLIPYRGSYVHALLITGAKQSDLIRCRNALPVCIEKHLITPYAHHGLIIKAR
ncbi:hypothetical protein FGIG_05188 [Fasciola gigantica]|uniref:Uncharacterized protein n=1 Tax=Fasciola gigantica TaxID=46835 RepID=A0A504ZCJ6_FASGI|nr:hypothetical protein FGIG_05188 [Fasciola gigantica]